VNLLGSVVLIIAHDACFDRRFLERLPVFTPKMGMPSLTVERSPAELAAFQAFGRSIQN
jgi:hypothetical protein